jgi:hypothetical protein
MVKIDREILLRTLRGYEEVNRITNLEKRLRLRALTDDEARAIFDGLCQDMVKLIGSEDQTTLANLRLQHHLRVREVMVKLAQAKGYESTI